MEKGKKPRRPRTRKPKEDLVREMRTIGVRVTDDVFEALKVEARKQRRTHSNLAAFIISEWVLKKAGADV